MLIIRRELIWMRWKLEVICYFWVLRCRSWELRRMQRSKRRARGSRRSKIRERVFFRENEVEEKYGSRLWKGWSSVGCR